MKTIKRAVMLDEDGLKTVDAKNLSIKLEDQINCMLEDPLVDILDIYLTNNGRKALVIYQKCIPGNE